MVADQIWFMLRLVVVDFDHFHVFRQDDRSKPGLPRKLRVAGVAGLHMLTVLT